MTDVRRLPASKLFDIQGGAQPPKSEFISDPKDGYGRFLQIRDFETDAHPTYIRHSPKWRRCEKEDTLIGRYGAAVGRICRGLSGYYNVALVKVIPKPGIDNNYLHYLLRSPIFQLPLLAASDRSAQAGFNKSNLDVIDLPVHDLADQIAIGAILSALDDKIELNRRMNETLEAQTRALFRDWFVDFGPVTAKMAGDTPYLAPDLWSLFPDRLDDDDLPEGWRPATLDAFATCRNRKANPGEVDDGTAYIGLEHMPRRSIALSEWEGAEKVTSAKSSFRRREILFGKLRPYFHKVGIAPVDGICSTDIVVLAPKKPLFEALTLACVSTDEFVAFTDQSSTGTKMPRTSWKIMRTYPMVMPNDTIADAFQSVCEPMIDRILANIEENRTLAQTRDLLLPKLMSGEIRVGDVASEELSAA